MDGRRTTGAGRGHATGATPPVTGATPRVTGDTPPLTGATPPVTEDIRR
jgi:hypothetical protein